MTGSEAEADACGKLEDPAADLEDHEAQGFDPHRGNLGALEPGADRIEQPVGGRGEEQAELVRPEIATPEHRSAKQVALSWSIHFSGSPRST